MPGAGLPVLGSSAACMMEERIRMELLEAMLEEGTVQFPSPVQSAASGSLLYVTCYSLLPIPVYC
jgi:hypothetical protein